MPDLDAPMPVIDNSAADAGIKVEAGKQQISTPLTTDSSDDSREISLDSPEEVLESPEVVKPKQVTEKETEVELKDEGFDLGEEEEKKEVEEKKEEPKKGRDYSDVTDEQKEILKHIPNYLLDKAKAYLKQVDKITQERDQLKTEIEKVKSGQLPDNYYEHEKAYLLHPEYEKLSEHQGYVDFAETHWEQQLEAIENGQTWFELKWDKEGKPVYTEHKGLEGGKIDVKAKLYTQKVLNTLGNDRTETQRQIGKLTSEFKSKSEVTKKSFVAIDEKFFAKIKDITKLPKEAQNYYSAAKSWLNDNLPAYKNHPFIDFLAKAALSNVYKTQEISKLKAAMTKSGSKKLDEKESGPNSKKLGGSASIEASKEYDLNNLDKDF